MTRQIIVGSPVSSSNPNVLSPQVVDFDAPTLNVGIVPAAVLACVAASESGDPGGVFHQTLLTLTGLPITMRDTQQGGGVQVYQFPLGRILRLGATATITPTTHSAIASTLNSGVTCNFGVGSTTQANATLATTEQDIVQVTAWTSGTTIDVAAAAANGVGAGVLASLDGTTTPIAAFLNLAVAGATDIDADASLLISGRIRISWALIGGY